MINPWNGTVFFSEQLVDLGVVRLSDFFTWLVLLPTWLSAPPTACRGQCGGQDRAALWFNWSGTESWHCNLLAVLCDLGHDIPLTFALIVKWGCYPKLSRKAVVQFSWDGWKASFPLYELNKCFFLLCLGIQLTTSMCIFIILWSLQRSFINMITFPKYLIKSCWPIDFIQLYDKRISFI